MNDKIEQEIIINAPINTVWQAITKPEHINEWFGATVKVDVRPGSKGTFWWETLGEAPVEIVSVDEPHLFSFSWTSPDEEMERAGGSTLVAFNLSEEGSATRVRLTESGFVALQCSDEDKASLIEKHSSGWQHFAGELQKCVLSLSGK